MQVDFSPIGLMNIKGLRLGMDVLQISSPRLGKRHFETAVSTKAVLAQRSKGQVFSVVPHRPADRPPSPGQAAL